MWRIWCFSLLLLGIGFLGAPLASAQEVQQELRERVKAEVLEIIEERERTVTGTGATVTVQEVRVELLEGERVGEVVRFENDMVELEAGDEIFVFRLVTMNGQEIINFADFERRPVLALVALLFVVLLTLFAGWHGLRSLLTLLLSVAAIIFILLPALLAGYDPALTSVGIAGAILALVLFGTHGVNPRTMIAFGGTFAAVCLTGGLAYASVQAMRLTGFGADASVYLNFATGGALDLA